MASHSHFHYHAVLNLPPPTTPLDPRDTSINPLDATTLRKAYKAALLSAHPDSRHASGRDKYVNEGQKSGYTVDEVKEAYSRLREGRVSLERGKDRLMREGMREAEVPREGLEMLDLDDFKIEEGDVATRSSSSSSSSSPASSTPSSNTTSTPISPHNSKCYTHSCLRCGTARGFCLQESDLETAAERGDTEVYVGCGGCSLWVRVGFGVVEDGQDAVEEKEEKGREEER